MKSLTHAGSLPRGQEKCKKTLQQSPLIDTEAKMASANYSPFFEKGARGIRFRNQSSQPPSPRRSVTARIRLFNSISLININFSANHSPFRKGDTGILSPLTPPKTGGELEVQEGSFSISNYIESLLNQVPRKEVLSC
ncbi:hypothetical protein AWW68_12055 [Roseivirga spongicola]|mgnify:CR=1 FL=1|uniref:Uncharacterized protein n=1 Tax=Roseivirga spongicola TaxID=333140 RepID=A0A150X3X5_9BACT|nr:hypothetical protein AWW68_12055 [Roseivirga spongicola]